MEFQLNNIYNTGEFLMQIKYYMNRHFGSFTLTETDSGLLSKTEIESRDLSLSLCNVNMFCIVQCSHQVWNSNPSPYTSPFPAM